MAIQYLTTACIAGIVTNMNITSQDRRFTVKKVRVDNKVKIIGFKNFGGKDKLIDYYILNGSDEKLYAFSKVYTNNTYNMCKSGIMVNELIAKRSRDTGVMRLVNYTNLILPYLAEEYQLLLA